MTGGVPVDFLGLFKRFMFAIWVLIGVIGRFEAARADSEAVYYGVRMQGFLGSRLATAIGLRSVGP